MIIEFNGPPGTGKTTVAKELEKIFKEQNICCNMYGKIPSVTKKELIICFIKGGWKIYFSSLLFLKKEVSTQDKMRKKIALLILAYYLLFCKYAKEEYEKVLICDQGIFQALISMAHIDKISNVKYAKKVIENIKDFNIFFVNCEVNAQLSKERIQLRQNGGSRFDKMSEKERSENLLKQQENFEVLRAGLKETVETKKMIKIDTFNEPQVNAQIIFDSIVEKK